MRPLWAGEAHVLTLNHMLSALRTSRKSALRGPRRRVDNSTTLEFVSFSATEPISRPKLVNPMQRTRVDRRCRSRETISGLLGAYRDAHCRLEARGMTKPRPRHEYALAAARTHVCDITVMVGFNKSART